MKAGITLEGVPDLKRALKEATADVRKKVYRVVEQTAYDVHATAIKKLQQGPATGRVYEKTDPNRTHQASAPGEPPMSDTGALANSTQVRGRDGEYYIYTTLPYGASLEFGTSLVAARPWLFPSVEQHRVNFYRKLREVIK